MSVRIKPGQSALENLAVTVRLADLGLNVDRDSREVSEASNSKVKGGIASLESVAVNGEIGLRELDLLDKNFSARVKDAVSHPIEGMVAPVTILWVTHALKDMAKQFDAFGKSGQPTLEDAFGFLRAFDRVPRLLDRVAEPGLLRHASRKQINQVRSAYADLLHSFADRQEQVGRILTGPITREVLHDLGEYHYQSRLAQRDEGSFASSSREAELEFAYRPTEELGDYLRNYRPNVAKLLGQKELFA